MNRNSFRKAAIAGTVIAAAFSGTSFAQDSGLSGAWKIDTARFYGGQVSLSIERDAAVAGPASAQFIVVDGANVYLATGMDAHAMNAWAPKLVDFSNAGGKLVLIGTHAHRADVCSFRCQYGIPERSMRLEFTSVEGAEQLMGEVVAYNKK
jgi:hypothetical protein